MTSTIPIINVSTNAMAQDIEIAKAAGYDDYISKPISIELLLKKV